MGLEVLNYSGEQDFAIVTGTGRIGAAISPSSYEDSFFGNMSYESSSNYLQRKLDGKKYKSNKMSFGSSFKLFDNKKKKMKTLRANLGVIAKYNKDSKIFNYGAGASLEISLLSLGYTRYKDDYFIKADPLTLTPDQSQRYVVDTFTFGIKLPHLVADYTYLVNKFDFYGSEFKDKITLITATLFYKKFMFTYGHRKEESFRPRVNFDTKSLEYIEDKYDVFLGVQYSLNRHFILGAYYNYYLNYGYTIGLTGFL